MLDMKGIDYRSVHVMPGNQRIHLRLAGFRGGTVPALKIDGRRIQGSCSIARELDALKPEPRLYPADADGRRKVEEAERWADEEFQSVPRRIFRYALMKDVHLREWLGSLDGSVPAPSIAARVTAPVSRYYAWVVGADEDQARRDVASLPRTLDQVDEYFEARIATTDPPNAATLQLLCTVRSLLGFTDFAELVGARSYAQLARELFPDYPEAMVPPFVERLRLG